MSPWNASSTRQWRPGVTKYLSNFILCSISTSSCSKRSFLSSISLSIRSRESWIHDYNREQFVCIFHISKIARFMDGNVRSQTLWKVTSAFIQGDSTFSFFTRLLFRIPDLFICVREPFSANLSARKNLTRFLFRVMSLFQSEKVFIQTDPTFSVSKIFHLWSNFTAT